MHPALEALTPEEAMRLSESPWRLQCWLSERDVPLTGPIVSFIEDRADQYVPPPAPRPAVNRHDTTELLELMRGPVELPFRVRQVAQLCIEEGLTLDQCATQLGIARDTVRAHLRRLRLRRREMLANTQGH